MQRAGPYRRGLSSVLWRSHWYLAAKPVIHGVVRMKLVQGLRTLGGYLVLKVAPSCVALNFVCVWTSIKSSPATRHEGACRQRRYSSYSFSNSALDGGEWSASRPGRALAPGKRTHCTGGWVGPKAGLDTEARGKILSPLPGIEPRSPGRPARSQTLYWMSYPAHRKSINTPVYYNYIQL
jgi:hypothetical protein